MNIEALENIKKGFTLVNEEQVKRK